MIKLFFSFFVLVNFSYSTNFSYVNSGNIASLENYHFVYFSTYKNLKIIAQQNQLDKKTYLSIIGENNDCIAQITINDGYYIYKVLVNDSMNFLAILYGKYEEEGYNIETFDVVSNNLTKHEEWTEDLYLFDKFLFIYKEDKINIYENDKLLQKIEDVKFVKKSYSDNDNIIFKILCSDGFKSLYFSKADKKITFKNLKKYNIEEDYVKYFEEKNGVFIYISGDSKNVLKIINDEQIIEKNINIKSFEFNFNNVSLIFLNKSDFCYIDIKNIIDSNNFFISKLNITAFSQITNPTEFNKIILINDNNFCLLVNNKYLVFANIENDVFNVLQIKEFSDDIIDVCYDDTNKKIFVCMKKNINIIDIIEGETLSSKKRKLTELDIDEEESPFKKPKNS